MRLLASARNITIRAQLVSNATIVGDADEIEQAVLTIRHNAVKYAATDGFIEMTLNVHNQQVALAIADDGRGFTVLALAHAFGRFWSENGRGTGGASHGLGLAIALTIVERHHGTIGLANRPDGGSIVTLAFAQHFPET